MEIRRNERWIPHWLGLLSLAMLLWAGSPLLGQSATPQTGSDITERQVASLDRFMDSHPEIAEQLRRNPSLINNEEFVENHPALQDYLQRHPGVREEFSENPRAFMKQEQRFEGREEGREGVGVDNDITRREISGMDNFLDKHPEIGEQLQRNPSLINNKEFVDNHPELQQYLQEHPGIREQFAANPQAFMNREQRFEQHEEPQETINNDRDNDRDMNRNGRDMNRRPLAGVDNFMDNHPEIAEQLQRNPSLINNKEFVENHPDLQQFLQQHPEVREQFQANPQAFMQREQRYEQREERGMSVADRDRMHADASGFSEFLGGHAQIAQEVNKNPSLINDKDYLDRHTELREYLNAHPAVKQQMAANPKAFLGMVQQSDNNVTGKAIPPKKRHQ